MWHMYRNILFIHSIMYPVINIVKKQYSRNTAKDHQTEAQQAAVTTSYNQSVNIFWKYRW